MVPTNKEKVLWTGDITSTNTTAILNDSANNYKRIVVIGYVDSNYRNRDFYTGEQTEGELSINYANSTWQYHYGCIFSILETILTITSGWAMVYSKDNNIGGSFTGGNQIHITKVIGYK